MLPLSLFARHAYPGHVPRCFESVLRTPCISLHRYPIEGVNYFLEARRITRTDYFNTFVALLGMQDAAPMRAQLAESEDKLLSLLGVTPQSQQSQQVQGADTAKPPSEGDQQPAAGATASGRCCGRLHAMFALNRGNHTWIIHQPRRCEPLSDTTSKEANWKALTLGSIKFECC